VASGKQGELILGKYFKNLGELKEGDP